MPESHPQGYLALPADGKGPGLLVLHAWWGLNGFFRNLCDRLAREGFVAFAPDLYHGETATTIGEAERLRGKLKQKRVAADLAEGVDFLAGREEIAGQALGVIGFSLGAYYALGLSLDRPKLVRAVVVFYGTRGGDYESARAAYLGHFAETDDWVAASGVKKLERALRAAGRPVSFYTYEATGHWFFEKDRSEAYRQEAARLAWERTITFLREHLGR